MNEFQLAFADAKKHAREVFPEESCGFIVDGKYIAVKNTCDDPNPDTPCDENCTCRLCTFKISKADTAKYIARAQMVLHSHPMIPGHPSKADMEGQIASNIPWGIIPITKDRIGDPEVWGDQLPIQPLLGRQFLHGIRDCYSVIRDTFRTGADGLREQGVTGCWPYAPIELREVPRDDNWWETSEDLYGVLPPSHGWKEIKMNEAQPGDVFLVKIRSEKFNHAGVLVAPDLILHHLPQRFSRREPAGIWGRNAGRWLRYTGISTHE